MMKKKHLIAWLSVLILAFALMAGGCGGGGGGGDDGYAGGSGGGGSTPETGLENTKALLNPEFIEWQERIARGEILDSAYGFAPEPVDWSHLGDVDYGGSGRGARSAFPSSYTIPNVTGVRDQDGYGTCWAHGALASLESTVIKKGLMLDPDFSERHVAWYAYHSERNTDVAFTNVYNYYFPAGGLGLVTAMLSRWTGPADEKDCVYLTSDMPSPEPEKPAGEYARAVDVTDVYNLSIAKLSGAGDSLAGRASTYEAMKELLVNEGALSVTYYSNEKFYNGAAYYYPSYSGPNHIVAIVGWDDKYSKDNFVPQTPGDGAWLIKNSWGTYSGDGGYFWISYYDATLGDVALYKAEKTGGYNKMYYYDPLGFIGTVASTSNSFVWSANVFTATENEQIEAVAFDAFDALTDYEVRIYKNLTDPNNPSSGTLQTAGTTTGHFTYAGYHTVRLNSPVQISAGERFSIVIKISHNRSTTLTAELWIKSATEAVTASPGQSFFTRVNEPGVSTRWTDLYNDEYKTNLCIRALTNPVSSAEAPVIATDTLPDGTAGTAYSQTLAATGTAPITWAVTSGDLPDGLELNAGTGIISGTPATPGDFDFTARATNVAGSAEKPLSISVTGLLEITTSALPAGVIGAVYSQTIEASGTEPLSWAITARNLPPGLSLDAHTGVISGTPSAQGTFDFTVTATDTRENATKPLSIIITSSGGNWIDVADTSWYDSAPNSTAYTIRNALELAGLAKLVNNSNQLLSGKTITLANDIDLAGKEWTPIGRTAIYNFQSVFDGDGYTISNLTITGDVPEAGLFGRTRSPAVVRDINLTNVNIDVSPSSTAAGYGYALAGGIVGFSYGTVSGCVINGRVITTGTVSTTAGGVVGTNHEPGTVLNCTSNVDVSSRSSTTTAAGGIAGMNTGGVVSSCTSTGDVFVSDSPNFTVGGIVGSLQDSVVTDCHKPAGSVNGIVVSSGHAGGIVASLPITGSPSGSIVTGNTFSQSATGQTYGIGYDGRYSYQPSNDGATPLP